MWNPCLITILNLIVRNVSRKHNASLVLDIKLCFTQYAFYTIIFIQIQFASKLVHSSMYIKNFSLQQYNKVKYLNKSDLFRRFTCRLEQNAQMQNDQLANSLMHFQWFATFCENKLYIQTGYLFKVKYIITYQSVACMHAERQRRIFLFKASVYLTCYVVNWE